MKDKDNNQLKIEKNCPMPIRKGDLHSTLAELKVGDSFVLEKSRRSALSVLKRLCGIQITTRSISDDEVRVWRIQ